jgi:DNA-binding NtrC family response regulator
MPDTNGIDLAKRIEKLYPDTVIIMITAYGDDMLREEAAQSPIRRIMDKPVQIAEIRDVTMEALGRLEEQYEGDNPD